MSNILEQIRLQNHHEYVFPDGLKVGFHYPDVEEFILEVGAIPTPALALAPGEKPTEEQALSVIGENSEAFRKQLEVMRKVVIAMLDDVNGEAIDPDDDRDAIVSAFGMEKRQVLFLIATRQMDPDPKVEPAET
jgi:hypothetical protein